MKFRNGYDGLNREFSKACALVNDLPSMTIKSHAKDADIKNIYARFRKTGQLPQMLPMPQAMAFHGIFDFQSAQNVLLNAQRAFDSLPSKIRKRFNHSPQEYMEFVVDPANIPEARALGISIPEVVAETPAVSVQGGSPGGAAGPNTATPSS